MLAKLVWTGSPTIADVESDVIAVLTGETDKSNLSASINQGASSIVSTIAAGWTVWDSSTGQANEQILRAPTVDDASQYKYAILRFNLASSDRELRFSICEEWDVDTNIATNETPIQIFDLIRVPIESQGDNIQELIVSATARRIWIRRSGLFYQSVFPCLEISRIHPCLVIGNGYVPAVQINLNQFSSGSTTATGKRSQMSRIVDDAGIADIAASFTYRSLAAGHMRMSIGNDSFFDHLSEDKSYDMSNVPFYGIYPVVVEVYESVGSIIGYSNPSDVWIAQAEAVSGFEDQTTHDLDGTDDIMCFWESIIDIASGNNIRIMLKAE